MWIWPAAGRADQSRDTLDSFTPTGLDSPCLVSALLGIFSLSRLRIAFSTRNFLWEVKLKKKWKFLYTYKLPGLGSTGHFTLLWMFHKSPSNWELHDAFNTVLSLSALLHKCSLISCIFPFFYFILVPLPLWVRTPLVFYKSWKKSGKTSCWQFKQ